MEIWAFANIYTAAPHTTSLPDTLTSTHRFWNATFAQNTPNISTVIGVTTTTSSSSNLESSWTYQKPTMHISTAVPVSATVSRRARCNCVAALFISLVVVSLWGYPG
ncbi:hypothetical protein CGCFRS4_v015192 [Colletotrichum fructicola]|nr:hypothetical protein CGCFRS4_v015192 [Colletotrichum fructicola]